MKHIQSIAARGHVSPVGTIRCLRRIACVLIASISTEVLGEAQAAPPSQDPSHPQSAVAGPTMPVRHLRPLDRERVYYDSPGAGALWARGATYKAGFGPAGMTYAPFLGSKAPGSHPVTLRIESVTVGGRPIVFQSSVLAQRAGDIVRYERGAFAEIYELGPRSIEQRFVFESHPEGALDGDLVLRLSSETDLLGLEIEGGLEFRSELGAVHYGRATAIDANGTLAAAATVLTGQGLEIRVPGGFVSTARFPLTIDPVITTFSIDVGLPDDMSPDVAYDASTNRWLAVYEEVFSASDHDVVYRLLDSNAVTVATGFVDASLTDYWANPACANNHAANQFLIVAEVGVPSSGLRKIIGRELDPVALSLGGAIDITAGLLPRDRFHPDVGGDPSPVGPSHYLVVWETAINSSDHDIEARLIHSSGSPGGPVLSIDGSNSALDTLPSISKSNDRSNWNIVWQRDIEAPGHVFYGARVRFDGVITSSSFSIISGFDGMENPSASSCLHGTSTWAIAYQRRPTLVATDIFVATLEGTNVAYQSDLSGMEVAAGSPPSLTHLRPDIDSDGNSFAVAYAELDHGTSDFDVYAATFSLVGGAPTLSEGHLPIATTTNPEDHPAIASAAGAGGIVQRQMIVLDERSVPLSLGNIEGAFIDDPLFTSFCLPESAGVGPCPCGNPESGYGHGCDNSAHTGGAQLVASFVSSLSNDTMKLTSQLELPSALTVFNQGNAVLISPLVFGQGIRCVGGSLKRLYIKTASHGAVTAPAVGDPQIHSRSAALGDPILPGTKRYYYAYYRDPVVPTICPSANTFNTTHSVQAIWIP